MLNARDVQKRYGDRIALAGVSIEVARGEAVALVGESGSGKTTLLRLFNRTVAADQGTVIVDGHDVTTVDPVMLRRRIGYVQQDGGLIPHWRVLRNAALVPALLHDTDADEKARAALAMVGLAAEEFGERWPGQLSGGQRQRVAIARALAANPTVLLLDEAFSALDAITRGEVHEAFLAARSELATTTLLVTHDLREAVLLAQRMVVLRNGRVEQDAPCNVVVEQPATPYVAKLVEQAGLAA